MEPVIPLRTTSAPTWAATTLACSPTTTSEPVCRVAGRRGTSTDRVDHLLAGGGGHRDQRGQSGNGLLGDESTLPPR